MQKDFQKRLITGKIAEIIFQQMFIEDGKYTVIPFGYERVLPELVKYKENGILKNIRNSPDFVLAYKDENINNIFLVEIKYQSRMDSGENLSLAIEQNKRWSPSWVFVATPGGFFFDDCRSIIKNKGEIRRLFETKINKETQEKYLKILKEFLI